METLKGKEIKQILSHHLKSIKTKTFIAIINKNSLGYPRFAFIASKRFSKKAVVRNRAKRLLREAIRINFSSLKNLSYDIVLIARKYISEAKLQGAKLTNTNFRYANLQKADFSDATFENTDFTGADLRGAKFTDIDTDNMILTDVIFKNPEPIDWG